MSKNLKVNGNNYYGVSEINFLTTTGAVAKFKDADEIPAVVSGTFESGTFVGDGSGGFTIPVNSEKRFLVLRINDDVRTNITEYPEQSTLLLFCDKEHNIAINLRKYSAMSNSFVNGAAYDLSGIIEFGKDSIVMKRGVAVWTEPFVGEKTYSWYAW